MIHTGKLGGFLRFVHSSIEIVELVWASSEEVKSAKLSTSWTTQRLSQFLLLEEIEYVLLVEQILLVWLLHLLLQGLLIEQ